MPKTIAITPSWYWPAGVPRVLGVPPFRLDELLVERRARRDPDGLALVAADARMSNRELAGAVAAAASSSATPDPAALGAIPTAASVVALLGALAAGRAVTGVPDAAPPAVTGPTTELRAPVLGIAADDAVAWHSHRSLLAGALTLPAFLALGDPRPWVSTFPLTTWEGVLGVTAPLVAGASVVCSESGGAALEAVGREGAGLVFTDLDSAHGATRDAKKEVKHLRGVLSAMLLSTGRTFDADARRRVGRLFECAALTMFGMPETGPIFGAHASWYVDEAIGIPVSNAHVVPVDPRSGVAIQTLWEFVESAMVTMWSPTLMVGYGDGAHPERIRDGRFVTGVVASSDANGMIYLLPD